MTTGRPVRRGDLGLLPILQSLRWRLDRLRLRAERRLGLVVARRLRQAAHQPLLVGLLLGAVMLSLLSGVVLIAVHADSPPHLQVDPGVINASDYPGDPSTYEQVTLTNSGGGLTPLAWAVQTPLPSWLSIDTTSGSLAAGASQYLGLTFTPPSATPQSYSGSVTFTSSNADNSPLVLPVTLSVGYYSRTWYFAEGYTGGSFSTYLTLANPNPSDATVTVEYLLQGQLPLTKNYSVLSNARYTISVNHEIGPDANVAMAITSDLPIVAERPMYFTYTGMPGVNVPGGTDSLGAPLLGNSFAFAYLDTTTNHDTYLTVLNQNSVPIDAQVTYYPAAGGVGSLRVHTVGARSRGTIKVNTEGLGSGTFSAVVNLVASSDGRTSALGLVERPMYFVDAVTGATGAADVIGMPTGSTKLYFAEGYTSPQFSERYILANPLSSSSTRATLTFYEADGSQVQQTVAISPGQQVTVNANALLSSNDVNNSAYISSDQPILAERFMSFNYIGPVGTSGTNTPIPGATDVLGATAPSDLYYFAEGYTGWEFGEWLTIENPQGSSVSVTVTYLPQDGSAPTTQMLSVPGTSRYTVLTNQVMPNQSFSMIVQASAPIVAERPMYFVYNGAQTGGSDTIGFAPHLLPASSQGFCFCAYATTGDLDAGGLDENTGLLQYVYPTDIPLYGSPLVDPSNSATFYTVLSSSYYGGNGLAQVVAYTGPNQEWRFSLSSTQYVSGLAISGAHLYVGVTDYSASTYSLEALNTYDGSLAWSTPIYSDLASTPLVSTGVVYATTDDALYAISDSNGQVLWQDATPSSYAYGGFGDQYAVAGPTNGLVYFRTRTRQTGGGVTDSIEGISTSNGAVVWSATVPSGGSVLALNATATSLYADDGNSTIYAFNPASGAQEWTYTGNYPSLLAAGDGLVLAAMYTGSTDALVALDGGTGAVRWQYTLSSNDYFETGVYIANYIGGAGQSVYFGTSPYPSNIPPVIHSLDVNTGNVNWQFQTQEAPVFCPCSNTLPILTVGYSGVYYETSAQTQNAVYVYKIDAGRGTQTWKTELDVSPNTYTPEGGISLEDQISSPFPAVVEVKR